MKKSGYFIVGALSMAIVAGGIYAISLVARQPLGPKMDLQAPAADTNVQQVDLQPAQVQATPQNKKTCGSKGQTSLLVIGEGKIEDGNLVRAGAVRLVVVDYDRVTAAVLTLPSELWGNAQVLKDNTLPQASLDMVYKQTFDDAGNVPVDVAHTKGTQALAQAVVDTYGFLPDHYITVLQEPFVEMVDDLGGVDVNLAAELTSEKGVVYPAGLVHLDGFQTLEFTRMDRKGGPIPNRWGRFEQQTMVTKALLSAVLETENWAKVPDMVKDIRKAVLTDLSVDQALDLVCMVEAVGDDTLLLQVEPSMVTVDNQGRWIPDIDAIKAQINQLYGR